MIPVEEAAARLLALARPLPAEPVPLTQAAGRWMAEPALARRDQPPSDPSAMDGYAVQGDPAPGDSFTVIGEAGAAMIAKIVNDYQQLDILVEGHTYSGYPSLHLACPTIGI